MFSKIYQILSYPLPSMPSKEQLFNHAIDWNKERLNGLIAQFLATVIILPVAFLVAKIMIRPCPVDWLLMKLIYELAVQTVIVAPMMSGYLPLKKKLSDQLLKIDLVDKSRKLLNWWKQPSAYPLSSMVGVIASYTLIYKYQEWIGLTLGGMIVHQALKISLYSMMLVYSNLLFTTVLEYLKDIRQEKECKEMLQGSWIMMDSQPSVENQSDDNDSFIGMAEILQLAEQTQLKEKSIKKPLEKPVEKPTSLTDSSIASDGQKMMLDFSLSESQFKREKIKNNEMSQSIRTKVALFEKFQKDH